MAVATGSNSAEERIDTTDDVNQNKSSEMPPTYPG